MIDCEHMAKGTPTNDKSALPLSWEFTNEWIVYTRFHGLYKANNRYIVIVPRFCILKFNNDIIQKKKLLIYVILSSI